MPELCSVLCSWLFPVAKFYLQILAKHLAPLWHSKTSRFLSARLPAQSSLLLAPSLAEVVLLWGGGCPGSRAALRAAKQEEIPPLPWGECAGEKCCRGRGITSCLIPHVCPTGES